jgi:hypothetical protein
VLKHRFRKSCSPFGAELEVFLFCEPTIVRPGGVAVGSDLHTVHVPCVLPPLPTVGPPVAYLARFAGAIGLPRYCGTALLMMAAAVIELRFGIDAEGRALEEIAAPLST